MGIGRPKGLVAKGSGLPAMSPRLGRMQSGDPMSRNEIAAQLGLTRQRVEQIEAEALRKLRAGLQAKGFDLDDFFDR